MDKESLKKQVEFEIENLERLVKEMVEITEKIGHNPGFIETRAAGSVIHDFYCGVEKIFRRIAIYINKELPKGEDWHTGLLLQMASPVAGTSGTVINQKLFEKLKEYLRFRHLFRNIYGFELKWEKFKDLSFSLQTVFEDLKKNLNRFMYNLDQYD